MIKQFYKVIDFFKSKTNKKISDIDYDIYCLKKELQETKVELEIMEIKINNIVENIHNHETRLNNRR